MACVRARDEQVRQVGARDQKNEDDGHLQHDERAADAADDVVLERIHSDAMTLWGRHMTSRYERAPLRQQTFDIRVGLFGRRAVLEPADQVEEMAAA